MQSFIMMSKNHWLVKLIYLLPDNYQKNFKAKFKERKSSYMENNEKLIETEEKRINGLLDNCQRTLLVIK